MALELGAYPAVVAYDEDLAERVRELISEAHDVTEQKMFGGLAFLIGGNMAVVVSGQGGLMVRADKAESARLVATTRAEPMIMRGRPMGGWLRIAASDVKTRRQLERWVRVGSACASALLTKPAKKRR